MENHLVTERVWCCVCCGTGKVRRLLFWKRDCHACEGTGRRRIIMDARFPEDIKKRLRYDAMFSANTLAALRGPGFGNSLANIIGL